MADAHLLHGVRHGVDAFAEATSVLSQERRVTLSTGPAKAEHVEKHKWHNDFDILWILHMIFHDISIIWIIYI